MAAKHTNPLAVRRMSQSNNPDVRAAALSEMEKMEAQGDNDLAKKNEDGNFNAISFSYYGRR